MILTFVFVLLFKVAESRDDNIAEALGEVNLKLQLWTGRDEFRDLSEDWRKTRFDEFEVQGMEDALGTFHKMVFRMERGLSHNKLVPKFRAEVIFLFQAVRVRIVISAHGF